MAGPERFHLVHDEGVPLTQSNAASCCLGEEKEENYKKGGKQVLQTFSADLELCAFDTEMYLVPCK